MSVFALTLVPTGYTIDEVLCTVQFSLPTLGRVELLATLLALGTAWLVKRRTQSGSSMGAMSS